MTKVQIYTGKTNLLENDFYDKFEMDDTVSNDNILSSGFTRMFGLNAYDDDYETIEFEKNSNIFKIQKRFSGFIDLQTDKNNFNVNTIDFMIVIETENSGITKPNVINFKDEDIFITYLGEYDVIFSD